MTQLLNVYAAIMLLHDVATWLVAALATFYCIMYLLAPLVRPFVPAHILVKGQR